MCTSVVAGQCGIGDLANWLTAVGTIALAVFAVVQVSLSRRDVHRAGTREGEYREAAKKAEEDLGFAAQAQADAQTEAELRAQAKQVVAWSWNVSVDLMQDDGYHEDARNGAGLVGRAGQCPSRSSGTTAGRPSRRSRSAGAARASSATPSSPRG